MTFREIIDPKKLFSGNSFGYMLIYGVKNNNSVQQTEPTTMTTNCDKIQIVDFENSSILNMLPLTLRRIIC